MMIKIDSVGDVLNSARVGHKIRVVDDSTASGGFIIYEWWDGSSGPNTKGDFDSWVPDEDSLHQFFTEAGWSIDWPA
ncbi:hypothetical protein [Pseudoxanthomonas sp. Root630]|uniref:hypothetical protein n=1 Tax=Pseudoxanthomonas sp. Root630 TaxID=1736574 RepID=UPI0007035043|nr:hypothetical protein [Pseudoxanthomonas sp. Root630]KRA41546.1 hypothetical protein ASD72_15860 [Pseudoxanthomonas sp. Root630]